MTYWSYGEHLEFKKYAAFYIAVVIIFDLSRHLL